MVKMYRSPTEFNINSDLIRCTVNYINLNINCYMCWTFTLCVCVCVCVVNIIYT